MEPIKRKDPLTGEEFVPKKISQRFATSASRIKFNNQKANTIRKKRSYIDGPLHSNQNILQQLMGTKTQETFHIQFLLGKGIDFTLSTGVKTVYNIKRHCLYEFIYLFDGQNVTIINNADGRYK